MCVWTGICSILILLVRMLGLLSKEPHPPSVGLIAICFPDGVQPGAATQRSTQTVRRSVITLTIEPGPAISTSWNSVSRVDGVYVFETPRACAVRVV
jgi:hypothetical protein